MTETEFEFDLVYSLPGEADEGAVLDALYEAGCDDVRSDSVRRGLSDWDSRVPGSTPRL